MFLPRRRRATVLGLLWAVTDLDLDRMTFATLSLWMKHRQNVSVKEAMASDGRRAPARLVQAKRLGRQACLLPNLTGGACVVLGLPL